MDLKYEFYISAKTEDVWNTLISPKETKKIFFGAEVQSTFQIGSSIKYVGPGNAGNETVHIYGKVLEFESNKRLTHTYIVGDTYSTVDKQFESNVSFELESLESCTKLTLIHNHWSKEDPTYENTSKGWRIILCNLKTLLETGRPLPI
jgi:uncharacterized protein YndB with AHSA1/START domain